MKKTRTPKRRNAPEMAAEYRFDCSKAKTNRFAEKMNLNVGWTVEMFVGEEKIEEKPKKSVPKKVASAKAKPSRASAEKKPAPKKLATKVKPTKKEKK